MRLDCKDTGAVFNGPNEGPGCRAVGRNAQRVWHRLMTSIGNRTGLFGLVAACIGMGPIAAAAGPAGEGSA